MTMDHNNNDPDVVTIFCTHTLKPKFWADKNAYWKFDDRVTDLLHVTKCDSRSLIDITKAFVDIWCAFHITFLDMTVLFFWDVTKQIQWNLRTVTWTVHRDMYSVYFRFFFIVWSFKTIYLVEHNKAYNTGRFLFYMHRLNRASVCGI
jgi:hypothetical protein